MGVKLKDLVPGKEVTLKDLSGKLIAVDAFNWIYQFLTTIRLSNGSYLTDSEGNITSHLNGLFYRSMNLLAENITPWFVFDGTAPKFKKPTNIERHKAKEEAKVRAKNAVTEEERVMYLRRTTEINDYIISSAKELLVAMGIPILQAPAEGEAQAARLNSDGLVYGVASQDYDTLLFGANRFIRNLNVTNKRKIIRKGITSIVLPEIIESKAYEATLGINREQLVLIAMLIGTDYNTGVMGIGPKKALSIVKKESKAEILKKYAFGSEHATEEIFDYFMNPNAIEIRDKPALRGINRDTLIDFLCNRHSFEAARINAYLDKMNKTEGSLFDYG